MNNLSNAKEWNDQTISEQFIRRVKLFLLQEEIRKTEKKAARYKIDATEYLNCLNEGIFHQIDQIRSLSFPIIGDIILGPEADPLVNMPNGAIFNSDSLVWDELFRKPVQVVTNNEMSKPHKASGHEFAPCIIDDRLFISVDVNTNRERLLSEFSKLINKDFIPYNTANKSQVTATPKIIRENAFIQILDYRITKKNSLKNAHKQLPKPAGDEMSFVREQVRFRLSKSDSNSSTLSRAAQTALKNLDKWLAEPAYITKLLMQ
ncbi:MAG: hypothetical protein ACI97K_002531 [Glaciecola sp.]|jgi:hypothetical protein